MVSTLSSYNGTVIVYYGLTRKKVAIYKDSLGRSYYLTKPFIETPKRYLLKSILFLTFLYFLLKRLNAI